MNENRDTDTRTSVFWPNIYADRLEQEHEEYVNRARIARENWAALVAEAYLAYHTPLPMPKLLYERTIEYPQPIKSKERTYRYYEELHQVKREQAHLIATNYTSGLKKVNLHLTEDDISIPSTWWLQAAKIREAIRR